MSNLQPQRIVVLCAAQAGVDTVTEMVRRGVTPAAIVGLDPESADPETVSGWIDVAEVAARLGTEARHVRSYTLKDPADRAMLEGLRPDLILVTAWQRLIPQWLIELPQFGAVGVHGSPDGIHGGRGRSPQNWALLLGCRSFEIALFRITAGIDEGPVLAVRRFGYEDEDDIAVSYYRATLAMADMIDEVLSDPERLKIGTPQSEKAAYYPQRMPEDGWADWSMTASEVARHVRALTRPYPGLRAKSGDTLLRLWRAQRFDDEISGEPGTISSCFHGGDFLVQCRDGRLLVRDWSAASDWQPRPGDMLAGRSWREQLARIIERHESKYPGLPLAARITRHVRA